MATAVRKAAGASVDGTDVGTYVRDRRGSRACSLQAGDRATGALDGRGCRSRASEPVPRRRLAARLSLRGVRVPEVREGGVALARAVLGGGFPAPPALRRAGRRARSTRYIGRRALARGTASAPRTPSRHLLGDAHSTLVLPRHGLKLRIATPVVRVLDLHPAALVWSGTSSRDSSRRHLRSRAGTRLRARGPRRTPRTSSRRAHRVQAAFWLAHEAPCEKLSVPSPAFRATLKVRIAAPKACHCSACIVSARYTENPRVPASSRSSA
jgi:hypothetical protein